MTGLEPARTYGGYLNQSDTMGLHVKNDNYDDYTHNANITVVPWEPVVNVTANGSGHGTKPNSRLTTGSFASSSRQWQAQHSDG
ncbi:hypothetical protein ACFX13_010674 [Malus domestica]